MTGKEFTVSDMELMKKIFASEELISAGLRVPEDILRSQGESAQWLNFLIDKLAVEPVRRHFMANDPESLNAHYSALINEWIFAQNKDKETSALNRFISDVCIKNISCDANSLPQLNNFHITSTGVMNEGMLNSAALRFTLQWNQIGAVELESALQYSAVGGAASTVAMLALPLQLSCSLKCLRVTFQISLKSKSMIEVSCVPDDRFLLDIEVGSLIGHRSKLKDLPRITLAVQNVIKKALIERVILPRTISIPISKNKE